MASKEEILTLHWLGVFDLLGRPFKTTNCLENTNGLIASRCSKVVCWENSSQRQRWVAAASSISTPLLAGSRGTDANESSETH